MSNINDGLGNELTEHEIIVTNKVESELKAEVGAVKEEAEALQDVSPTKAAYDAAAALKQKRKRELFGAFVDPNLANKGGGHGTVMGSTKLFQDPDASHSQTRFNLTEMQAKLEQQGWAKHPSIIDRWEAPNGVGVEMGYTHGEAWFRAVETRPFRYDEGPRVPYWVQRVHGYASDTARATFEGIFRDLMELARTERCEQGSGVWETRPGPLMLGFALLTPNAQLPTKTYNDDAGFDLYVAETTVIAPGEFVDVPLGVSVGLPPGVWARITGRSSTLRRLGLLVNEGIIDTGYTGPLFAGVFNVGVYSVSVTKGDRIAQLILHENTTGRFSAVAVDGHPETERGVSGFGSSGS